MITLTPNEITYLSASFKGQNSLSLFTNITGKPDGSEHKSLSEKGIIVNNAYDKKALTLLLPLTKPEICARLVIHNDFFLVEKYTYRIGDRVILAENENGAFRISEPEDFTGLLTDIYQCVGMSEMPKTDIAGVFTPAELLVFFAIIDMYRKNTLVGYVKGETPELTIGERELLHTFSEKFANGLAKTIMVNYNIKMPDATELRDALNSLKTNGYITTGTGIKLTEVYEVLARNFLIPDNVILHEMLELDEKGDLLAESSLALAAGVHDIISLVFDKENFLLTTPSAGELARSILITLECMPFDKEAAQTKAPPVAHTPPPITRTTPPPVVQPAPPQHNADRQAPGQGETRNTTPKFCSKCGASLPQGTKFCGKCGSKV